MRSHVRRYAAALREAPITDRTTERFLAGMRAHVCRQIGGLREALIAVRTAIRPFARMRAQMRFQRARSGVRFAAQPTQIRFRVGRQAVAVVAVAGRIVVDVFVVQLEVEGLVAFRVADLSGGECMVHGQELREKYYTFSCASN